MSNLSERLDELRSACSHADGERLESAAHNLKGAASNICAEPTRQLAERLEDLGRQNQLESASTFLSELERQVDHLRSAVQVMASTSDEEA